MGTEETNAAAGVGARNGAKSTARQRTGTENRASAGRAQSLDRYVKTRDAQQAVEGREAEFVQALGIPWLAGQRDHIRCPYPDGDTVAIRLCLERLVPVRKDRHVSFDLREINSAADIPKASAALLHAMASGEITPSESADIGRAVDARLDGGIEQ